MARPALRQAIRLALGVAIVAILIASYGPVEVARAISAAEPATLAAAFAVFLVVFWLRVVRLGRILDRLDIHVARLTLATVYLESMAAGWLLGGSVGADSVRTYRLAMMRQEAVGPLAASLIERGTGIAALASLALLALSRVEDLPVDSVLLGGVAGAAVIGGCAVVAAASQLGSLSYWLLARDVKWPAALRVWLERASASPPIGARRWSAIAVDAFLTGIVMQLAVLSSYGLMCSSLGFSTTWVDIVTLFPLIEMASMIPLTANNLGVKEALIVALLARAGQTATASLGLSLVYRSFEVALFAMGFAMLSAERRR